MSWSVRITPDQAQYRPGQAVRLDVDLEGPAGAAATVSVTVSSLEKEVTTLDHSVSFDASGVAQLCVNFVVPADGPNWQAYGADVAVHDGGEVHASSSTAFDVAPHWRVAPRYGFLTDFAENSGEGEDANRFRDMRALHLNCIQFYDWMWTHHTYIPPTSIAVDPLGRTVDFERIRRRIALAARMAMAPVAYASVYGAEQPFAGAHADWLLYDGGGQPMSLADMFFIQDPSESSGWRTHLFVEYRKALELGFVGLHCDAYGSPHAGINHQGRVVQLDEVLPGLVADADALARTFSAEGGALLNCVGGWPLAAAAQADGATLYVEVWPPHTTYRDLFELVKLARQLDPTRQLILAAYLPAFHVDGPRPDGALNGLKLASSAIFASGAFHLLPGEGAGVLADAYYPKYGRLERADWEVLRGLWDFQTRYGPLLADLDAVDLSATHVGGAIRECRLVGAAYSPLAEPRTVWTLLKRGRGYLAVHLINLLGVSDPSWSAPQAGPPITDGLQVRLEVLVSPSSVWLASPDYDAGRARQLDWRLEYEPGVGQVLCVDLPALDTWSMVMARD